MQTCSPPLSHLLYLWTHTTAHQGQLYAQMNVCITCCSVVDANLCSTCIRMTSSLSISVHTGLNLVSMHVTTWTAVKGTRSRTYGSATDYKYLYFIHFRKSHDKKQLSSSDWVEEVSGKQLTCVPHSSSGPPWSFEETKCIAANKLVWKVMILISSGASGPLRALKMYSLAVYKIIWRLAQTPSTSPLPLPAYGCDSNVSLYTLPSLSPCRWVHEPLSIITSVNTIISSQWPIWTHQLPKSFLLAFQQMLMKHIKWRMLLAIFSKAFASTHLITCM